MYLSGACARLPMLRVWWEMMLNYCLTQLILSALNGENSIHITSYPQECA